ncbi:hypothetical protein [Anabaena sp. UHCC 0187]|nr:hypothetical protein [Anabaena sp. UHCC 0187]
MNKQPKYRQKQYILGIVTWAYSKNRLILWLHVEKLRLLGQ